MNWILLLEIFKTAHQNILQNICPWLPWYSAENVASSKTVDTNGLVKANESDLHSTIDSFESASVGISHPSSWMIFNQCREGWPNYIYSWVRNMGNTMCEALIEMAWLLWFKILFRIANMWNNLFILVSQVEISWTVLLIRFGNEPFAVLHADILAKFQFWIHSVHWLPLASIKQWAFQKRV